MKRLLIAWITVTLALTACSHKKDDGGISGGGGDVINPGAAGEDYVSKEITFGARPALFMLLKGLTIDPLTPVLFGDRIDGKILEKVMNFKIEMNKTSPCIDNKSKPKDGSIYAKPGFICISTFRLGQKTTRLDAYPKLMSVLAHEYSHLIGFNEDDAYKLEDAVMHTAAHTVSIDALQLAQNFYNGTKKALTHLQAAIDVLSAEPDLTQRPVLIPAVSSQIIEADKLDIPYHDGKYSVVDRQEYLAMQGVRARLRNLERYLCSIHGPQTGECDKILSETIFKGENEVSARDFLSRTKSSQFSNSADGMVRDLRKVPDQLLPEIKEVHGTLSRIYSEVVRQLFRAGLQLDH